RDRLRAMAADLVASWRSEGMPAAVRTAAGLRTAAEGLVHRAAAGPEHVGWTMVTIVSEFWRNRVAAARSGRRLLLLPDCPCVPATDAVGSAPVACGPACGIATIWAAARDGGWVVESTRQAVSGIGALVTGQYDGVLGIARLRDLEKAFAMLPAFSLPVAAVPYEPAPAADSCEAALAAAAIDVDWALGLLGVGGGEPVPEGDDLPLVREAAQLVTPDGLAALAGRLGAEPAVGVGASAVPAADLAPRAPAAALGGGFTTRGGKFLRPFVTLAAFDAVVADAAEPVGAPRCDAGLVRESAKAAALAIEVFHKASLVHDDIEDDDRVRYGRPALHVECGVPSAINAGDYLLGVGYRIIAGLPGVDAATVRDVMAILASAHVRLARGQGAELWWRDAAGSRLAVAEALEMYGLKTSPAFEAAVAIGIRMAGVDPAAAGSIDRYALHVGTGFQVLNDLKDWSGDVENDRRAAGDLLGGRPTLLWALAAERLPATDLERLRTMAVTAGRPDADEATVAGCLAEARRLYGEADVFARAAAIAADQRSRAVAALAACRLRRLREVLEFLLDLAVPAQSAAVSDR
ncbi:MAG: polyprenyl synthetase family protein, partial [Planctomycetaceae bacterium]